MDKSSYRQSFLMGGGTIVNSLLGLVFYILAARALPVSSFGYFSYLLGLGLLAAEIGDLGFNSAIVRFGSQDQLPGIFTLTFLFRMVAGFLIFLIFLVPAFLADHLIVYSAIVAVATLFSYLATQSLIAQQKYGWQVTANILGNASRLVLTILLISAGLMTALSALVIFCLGAAVTFLLGMIPTWQHYHLGLFSFPGAKKLFPQVYLYNRSLAVSFGLSSLAAKIDVPLLYSLSGPVAAGVYSSAQKLISVVPQLAAAIEGVFAPKLTMLTEKKSSHERDYVVLVIFLSLGLLAVTPFAGIIVPAVFGGKYILAIGVLQVMLVSSAVFLLCGPASAAILYKHGRSSFHLLSSVVALGVSLALYFLLVPPFGALGAALVSLFANLTLLLTLVFFKKRLDHA